MPKRPSKNEITKKVHSGLEAVRANRRSFAVRKHLTDDLDQLDLASEDDYWKLIESFLGEIIAANPLACYAGSFPPKRSYEDGIKPAELWAYAWESPSQNERMYLKFVLKDGWYFHVDCHESSEK